MLVDCVRVTLYGPVQLMATVPWSNLAQKTQCLLSPYAGLLVRRLFSYGQRTFALRNDEESSEISRFSGQSQICGQSEVCFNCPVDRA